MKDRSGERSAACATCGKTFARSDTLLRHQKSHHATEDRGPVHRVTNGTFRACSACAGARSRCSGGTPCGRCNLRQITCVYPTKRRKGSTSNEHTSSQGSGESPNQQMMGQFNEIVFATNNQNHSQYPQEPNLSSNKGNNVPSLPGRHSFSSQTQFQAPFETSNPEIATNVENMLEMPVHNIANSTIQPSQFTETTMPNQYPHDFNEPAQNYDYGQMDIALNWIPLSTFPQNYEPELDQSFPYLFPPLPDAPTLTNDFTSTTSMDTTGSMFQQSMSAQQANEQYHQNQGFPVSLLGVDQSPASSTSDGALGSRSAQSNTSTGEQKRKRRKGSFVPDLFNKPRNQKPSFSFPHLPDRENPIDTKESERRCSQLHYDALFNAFQKLCVENILPNSFESSSFPDIESLNSCVDLYFENFHSTFPIIHQPTFGSSTHWIVILAVAAIGSTFTRAPYALDLREAFQEFLRRAIHQSADGSADFALDVSLAHARILNLVGLVQSDSEQLRTLAPRYHADLSRWCLESGVLQLPISGDIFDSKDSRGVDQREMSAWDRWIRIESLRRIGYLTWLLDSSLAFMVNARPLCNMDDARTPLPCPESLWNASSPESWATESTRFSEMPSLCTALENLYDKKAVNTDLSEISQTLLIHALFQRTWEVGTHIKQPLSEWTPTGKARGFLNTPTKDNFWLPLYPLYANWRNSACDCLDILNWQASSMVAKASGVEHGLMLQLHLARIVLLTPFQEIQDLLFSLIDKVADGAKASFYVHDGSYQPRNTAKLAQIRKIIWRWLREDQHKARLAMVHAGSVFWYVRRYSSSSFYEPIAVYLASIVLFTYGSYKSSALDRDAAMAAAAASSRPIGGPSGPDGESSMIQPSRVERKVRSRQNMISNGSHRVDNSDILLKPERNDSNMLMTPSTTNHHDQSESDSETSSDQPEFIYLDRPCDDEMVQHFVRNGHNMSGHMSNVGDICTQPQKVLLEGAKLLRMRLSCWGVSREYYDILTKLADLRKTT